VDKKTIITRWLKKRWYHGLEKIKNIKKIRIGNLGLKFDKHFFRPFDITRVFLKRIFVYLHLRDTQSCKHCGRDQHIIWSVEDKFWNKMPVKYCNKCLCIECFVELYPKRLKTFNFTFKGFSR